MEMTARSWIPSYDSFTSAGKIYRNTAKHPELYRWVPNRLELCEGY
jgi:hypothetical protein